MSEHFSLWQALRRSRIPMLIGCLLVCGPAWADIDVDVKGVNEELRRNVLTYLSFERYKKRDKLDRDTLERWFRDEGFHYDWAMRVEYEAHGGKLETV